MALENSGEKVGFIWSVAGHAFDNTIPRVDDLGAVVERPRAGHPLRAAEAVQDGGPGVFGCAAGHPFARSRGVPGECAGEGTAGADLAEKGEGMEKIRARLPNPAKCVSVEGHLSGEDLVEALNQQRKGAGATPLGCGKVLRR